MNKCRTRIRIGYFAKLLANIKYLRIERIIAFIINSFSV